MTTLRLTIRLEREPDGRWIAEVAALPGVLAVARTRDSALRQAKAFALETIADLATIGDADIADTIHFDAAPTVRGGSLA